MLAKYIYDLSTLMLAMLEHSLFEVSFVFANLTLIKSFGKLLFFGTKGLTMLWILMRTKVTFLLLQRLRSI